MKAPKDSGMFEDFYLTVLPWMLELAVLKGSSKEQLYEAVDSAIHRYGERKTNATANR